MPFTLNNLPESAIEKESELLALAAGLTRADIVKAQWSDLQKLQTLLLQIERELPSGENLPSEVISTMQGIVAEGLLKKSLESRAAPPDMPRAEVGTSSSDQLSANARVGYDAVVRELQGNLGEERKNPRFDDAKSRLEDAVNNNNPKAMSKENLGVFFAHASPEEVEKFANSLSNKVYGKEISRTSSEGYKHDQTHNGSAVFVAFQDLLRDQSYSDIRSNPWLTNLGSRTFIESFFNENQARFTQVVTGESIYGRDRGKVFENLIDGALHTSIKGHEKSSFSFGMFAKDSHHDTTALSKIEALIHPSSGIEKKK